MAQKSNNLAYNLPSNPSNPIPGNGSGYPAMNRSMMKSTQVPGMGAATSNQMQINHSQMQGLNQAHLSGSNNQSMSMHSHNMQNMHQQQQFPFSSQSVMVNSNSMSSSLNSSYVGQGEAVIEGLDRVYRQPSSPNVELNINDLFN